MKIPQGYKQTELGIIPEDWEVKTIGDYYEVTSSKRVFQSQWRRIGVPFFRAREIVILADKGKVDNELFIDQELYDLYKRQYGVPQAGDVLVTGVGTLGRLYVVQSNDYPFYFKDGNIIWFKNKGYNSVLLSYLFQTDSVISQITDNSGGSTVGTYTIQNAINTKIITPNLPAEQNAIAEALSDVDALIAALDKKIAKKRLIKQGAMQQLLTGKKRLCGFSDEWTIKRLGDLAKMNSGGTPDSSNSEYYGGDIPFLSISDITSTNKYISRTEKTITEKGLRNSSARIFPIKTIMYAMYASLGKCGIANISLSCSQAILGITPSKNIDTEYLYYILSYIEETVKEFGQTGTQTNLSKQLVQDLELYLPTDAKEQQAIATILSDMDKEIADLEARRNKYKLIKSGMMQKLLTGQIRLVKPLAPIIPLETPDAQIREIPLQTHVVTGHIVNALYQSSGWGRTKLQKTLHLVGYHCQLDFGNDYIRNTAGPDDQAMMNHIDSKFKQYRHVRIEVKKENGKTRYNYIPTAMIDELEQVYETYPQTIRHAVDSLINKIKKMDLACAEIVSTLYAVWNNRIIKGEPISDDLLLEDFYAWSKHKLDFSPDQVLCELNYMRKEEIIPIGWGKYIDKK